jgi:thioredoxin reductase (NADPH)
VKAGSEAMPIRFVQIGSVSGPEIALPSAVLRSSVIELMGSGIGSIPFDRLVNAIGELLRATVPGAFKPAPPADFKQAWPQDESTCRIVITLNERGHEMNGEVGDDESLRARAVVVASGARYRRLDVPNLAQFEGSSVHYWASPIEAKLCGGQEVALVGAGNSAGQAAVYLASHVKKVWLLTRRESLEKTMSHYLVERIKAQPNIEVVTRCEVTALEDCEGNLESLRWRHCLLNEETTRAMSHLFLFIGAEPNTDWLAQCGVALDEKGFVRTGEVGREKRHALETNRSGVFAVGDVRSGSVKRVAAAVGEGAQVVSALHAYLARSGSAATSAVEIARA